MAQHAPGGCSAAVSESPFDHVAQSWISRLILNTGHDSQASFNRAAYAAYGRGATREGVSRLVSGLAQRGLANGRNKPDQIVHVTLNAISGLSR
jgi:hypothetical protein